MTSSHNNSKPTTGRRAKLAVLVEQTFSVSRPPEVVFDYLTNPSNLPDWQTSKTSVEQLTDGAPRLGTRIRERTKPPGGKEFEQIVEFTEFDRPVRVHAHIVDGPYPIDGTWSFESDGDGTRVHFVAGGELRGAAADAEASREARHRSPDGRLSPEPSPQRRGGVRSD
jgi:uncharacterized protein YndB with AHSA1/START domain